MVPRLPCGRVRVATAACASCNSSEGRIAAFYVVCSIGAVANVGVGTLLYARGGIWWLAGLASAADGGEEKIRSQSQQVIQGVRER